ncbi:MAG TPA: sugar ABC transporter substrate-binding protein [Chloroflexota bacterium]|jgi:multiple sugar transport system substrate-binding protein|nr:sugar ABC transporter substrate-binding protein [Chloroflexota bacterium]
MSTAQRVARRRLLAAAGAGGTGALLAACASGAAAPPQSAAAPSATIEYMHWAAAGGAQAVAREAAAKAFMTATPTITVNVSAVAPSGTMLEKFKTTAAAGTPPDLLTFNTAWYGDLIGSKMVANLDPLAKASGRGFQRDAFYPEVLSVLTADGKLYGLPRFVVTSVLFYNKDLFGRLGVAPPTDGWTWEKEFVEAGQRLKRDVDGGQAFAMDFAPNDFRDSAVFAWGNDYFDKAARKCVLDDAKAQAALQFAYDLRWKSRLLTSPDSEKAMGAQQQFLNARIGMYPRGNFEYANLQAAKVQFPIGAALMPRGPGGRRQYGQTTAYGIAEGSKAKEASWEFLKWLVGDAGQQHLVNTESITPATRKIYQSPDVPPEIWKVFTDAIKDARYFPALPNFPAVIEAVNKELGEALVADTRSVRDSARAAAEAANRLIAS